VESTRPERRREGRPDCANEEPDEDWKRGWNKDPRRDRNEDGDPTGAWVATRGGPAWTLGIVGMGGSAMRRSIVPEGYIPDSDPGKPKFQTRLPDYFFTGVKVIRNDQKSPFDFFLISLANRFNSAYYLLLNTGKWSGGETS
jgi:hypothetical protein